jgi:hypothetical protein
MALFILSQWCHTSSICFQFLYTHRSFFFFIISTCKHFERVLFSCICLYLLLYIYLVKNSFRVQSNLDIWNSNTSFFKYWYIFGQFVVLVHLNLAKITYILKTRFDCISVKHDISTILHTVYLVSSELLRKSWSQINFHWKRCQTEHIKYCYLLTTCQASSYL